MLITLKWLIAKYKCQCYEQANGSLLKKKYQCWEEIKMNDCYKQTSILTKCKLMIAKNKHPM